MMECHKGYVERARLGTRGGRGVVKAMTAKNISDWFTVENGGTVMLSAFFACACSRHTTPWSNHGRLAHTLSRTHNPSRTLPLTHAHTPSQASRRKTVRLAR
jgi:hypothetical protein